MNNNNNFFTEKTPKSWQLLPVGKVLLNSQYGTNEATVNDGNIEVVGMKEIQDGKILTNNLQKIKLPEKDINDFVLKIGDILINRTNSYELVGKSGIFNSEKKAVFASYLVRLIVNSDIIESAYLNYWLNSEFVDKVIKRIATRAIGQANINPTEFKKHCMVLVPTLPEQRAIVDVLESWDKAIALTEKLVKAKEKQYRWLTIKLIDRAANSNSNWVPTNLGRFIFERDEKSEINGQFPALTSSRKGIFFQDEYFSKQVTSIDSTGYKIIHSGDFTYRAMSDDGLFVFNRLSICEKGIISPAYGVFYIVNGDSDFFSYYLNSKAFHKEISRIIQGGTRTSLKLSGIKKIEINLPEISEQKKIADVLNSCKQELSILENIQVQHKKQKQALMQKLLTGEWRVKT